MKLGISLFSSGGIGDLALRANNIQILVANELLQDRADVFCANYPDSNMIVGDINSNLEKIVDETRRALSGRQLDFIFATPPCQGMSKNGRGKLLSGARQGNRESLDPRNHLIVPAIKVVQLLQPEIVIFENVPEMENTKIHYNGEEVNIIEFIKKSLPQYVGRCEVVEFANYGVPQRRQRLITIFTKNRKLAGHFTRCNTFLPAETHSAFGGNGTKPWITLRDVIGNLPPLDAKNEKSAKNEKLPFHRVPVLDDEKYFWIKNTPEGRSAFDNQCPSCGCKENRTHGTTRNNGINQSNKDTPIYCCNCGKLLPRPWVKKNEIYRVMRGYTSAYKRMQWDLPAAALTRNMSYACSDNKIHPSQNRVLSLHEAFIIHTIDCYEYRWERKNKKISDKTIREIIGESIPPKGLEYIITHILSICDGKIDSSHFKPMQEKQLELLSLK